MEEFGRIRAHSTLRTRVTQALPAGGEPMLHVVRAACWIAIALGSIPAHAAAPEKIPAYISSAVADPGRPPEDRQRDANRKPAETLQFAGIKPGDKVVELVPGRGYFTRILSKVVGPKGHLYALSPPRRPNAAPDSPDPVAATTAIAADPAYSNVSVQAGSLARISVAEPVDV